MKISKIAKNIHPSLTRRLFDKAKTYTNVIDFTLGDPDYQTPQVVKEAACSAIYGDKTKYSANAGIIELRKVVSSKVMKETGVYYDPTKEVIITVGAMESLYLTLLSVLDNGDEVIIPTPHWINYAHMVEMCGGVPVFVPANEENGFVVDVDKVKNAITKKTVAIIINSPNNPTGTIYDKHTLEQICALSKDNGFLIVWDECYKNIVYDGEKFVSILSIPDMKDNVVVINSCSKEYSMTGWRLGYTVAPQEIVACMTKLQENIVACASLPSQYAAIEALKQDLPECLDMRRGFEERRNVLVNGINSIDKLSCKMPKGTFYAFVNISQTGMDGEDFAYALLDSKQVAVVPGITYGESCKNYVRIAYTMSVDKIEEGLRRIEQFIKELEL